MKDLSLRIPLALPVAIGDTNPYGNLVSGDAPIIWSTIEGTHLYWTSSDWQPVADKGVVVRAFVQTGTSLVAGDLVNFISLPGGQAGVRKATTTGNDTQADGVVIADYASESLARVHLTGQFSWVTAVASPGPIWLAPNGQVTRTPPTSGLSQQVGFAFNENFGVFLRGTPVFIN